MNLKHPCKMLEFNVKSRNIKQKTNGTRVKDLNPKVEITYQ